MKESVVVMQNEEALLRQGRMRVAEGLGHRLCWNAAEFRVVYPSLGPQLCIGGAYVRLLLDGVDQVWALLAEPTVSTEACQRPCFFHLFLLVLLQRPHCWDAALLPAAGFQQLWSSLCFLVWPFFLLGQAVSQTLSLPWSQITLHSRAHPLQGAVEKVAAPKDLFQALYHHFLCLADRDLQAAPAGGPGSPSRGAGPHRDVEAERVLCIRAMAAVYQKHAGSIGALPLALPLTQTLRQSLPLSTAAVCSPASGLKGPNRVA